MNHAALIGEALRCHRDGDVETARGLYRRVLSADPRNSEALHLLGVIEHQLRQPLEAERLYRRAIAENPAYADVYNNLGVLLREQGRLAESLDCLRTAADMRPDDPGILNNMGLTLGGAGDEAGAIAAFETAIARAPSYADAWNNLGNALTHRCAWAEAAAAFLRALELRPNHAEAMNNLGNVFAGRGDQGAAREWYQRSAHASPAYISPRVNLANLAREAGDLATAESLYREALVLDGENAAAHWGRANALLLAGDFIRGWDEFEWRWRIPDHPHPPAYSIPLWDGEDLHEQSVVLWAEQGYGDALQFVRYVPRVLDRGGRVILHVPAALQRLFRLLPGVDKVVSTNAGFSDAHCHFPLMSLPHLLRSGGSIPPAPVIAIPEQESARWSDRFDPEHTRLRVGVVWAGNQGHVNDRRRSMQVTDLLPFAVLEGVEWFSLQTGEAGASLDDVQDIWDINGLMAGVNDFLDTSALLSHLDLVICVDTATAHLAGSLGKPVWVMLPHAPDWRWMTVREDSPWYPSMRLFRQRTPGDWARVVADVAVALRATLTHWLLDRAGEERNKGYGDRAIAAARCAVAATPDHAEARNTLGVLYQEAGRYHEARAAFEEAAALDPGHAEARSNLGNVYKLLGETGRALASLQDAVRLRPSFGNARYNLGSTLCGEWRLDEAEEQLRAAVQLMPEEPRAWNNLALTLFRKMQLPEAITAYRQALAIDPEHVDAHWNLAQALLLQGDYAGGWYEYEWRWRKPEFAGISRRCFGRRWQGEPLRGKRILILAEQGFGDQIQGARFATVLAEQGAIVILETSPELMAVMLTVPGVTDVVARTTPLPHADFCIPLMSVPGVLSISPDSVPARTPYVVVDASRQALWRQRLQGRHSGLRVGCVWSGSETNPDGRYRSIPIEEMASLFGVGGCTFVSLQAGSAARDLRAILGDHHVIDCSPFLQTFADTAAIIDALDLVITIDTSVAHLAGALGKPFWLLSTTPPDWRWGERGSTTPWYPSARVFRQERHRAWAPVLATVRAQLAEAVSGGGI